MFPKHVPERHRRGFLVLAASGVEEAAFGPAAFTGRYNVRSPKKSESVAIVLAWQ